MMNVEAQRIHSKSYNISLDSSLSPNTNLSSWLSPSGRFAFGFYRQGNGFAVGIWLVNQPKPLVVWTANRDDPPVSSSSTLTLKRNGLLLQSYDKHQKEIAVANFSSTGPNSATYGSASSAALLDSGNFVVYDNNSTVIWESFSFPTDTILGGQNLYAPDRLVSSASISDHSSGRFRLWMQDDGNLVAYPVNSSANPDNAYWSTGTYGKGFSVHLSLNISGFLTLLQDDTRVLTLVNGSYHGRSWNVIHRATLDVTGILRLYMHNFVSNDSTSSREELVWSFLQDECEVKGTCGLNSYCTAVGNKTNCNCYPGFVIDPTDTSGCYRNSSGDGCTSNHQDPRLQYKVAEMENVMWGDHPYSLVSKKNQQLCSDSCLEDCNCGAVLYTNASCNMYKLPIRYGRISKNISEKGIKGFIRVALGSVRRPKPTVPVSWRGENKSNKNNMLKILALSLGFIAFMCFVFAFSSFFLYKHRLHRYQKLLQYTNSGLVDQGYFTLQSFSYTELEEATDGFKEELGRGSFGAVYKGTLSGSTVAVKRLEKVVEEGVREFKAEITTIGRTHHRNLVQLLGFCIEGSRKLLVYEYMSNGSLADVLFKAKGVRLSWKERAGLVLDVAKGVLYLHDECSVHIIHCNLKPQNILLDHTWTGKISDFGLARLLVPSETKINSTGLVDQRRSYAAPELKKNAMISVKADIYSFGIVLLEIVCCRRNIEVNVSTPDDMILSDWVYNCYAAGELGRLVEEDENVDLKTLERMVKVGLWCVQDDPALRPFMKNVILMLEGTMDIPVPPSPGHPHLV
ncbi:PREDICTED: G-type lectin S-receptor-like serine/threonine-protein kinase RLK1-like [Fragaria vesca subsp. vesca]